MADQATIEDATKRNLVETEPDTVVARHEATEPGRNGGRLWPGQRRGEPGRNPAGRPPGGLVVEEWLNLLLHDAEMDRDALWRLAENAKTPTAKAIAANQALLARFPADLSDFEPFIDGARTLKQLKSDGVSTYGVKSCEVKRKRLVAGAGDAAQEWEIEHRKIELHDRSGPAFDRVMDRTVGRSRENKDVNVKIEHITPTPIIHLPAGFASMPLPGQVPTLTQATDDELTAELVRRGRLLPAMPGTPSTP